MKRHWLIAVCSLVQVTWSAVSEPKYSIPCVLTISGIPRVNYLSLDAPNVRNALGDILQVNHSRVVLDAVVETSLLEAYYSIGVTGESEHTRVLDTSRASFSSAYLHRFPNQSFISFRFSSTTCVDGKAPTRHFMQIVCGNVCSSNEEFIDDLCYSNDAAVAPPPDSWAPVFVPIGFGGALLLTGIVMCIRWAIAYSRRPPEQQELFSPSKVEMGQTFDGIHVGFPDNATTVEVPSQAPPISSAFGDAVESDSSSSEDEDDEVDRPRTRRVRIQSPDGSTESSSSPGQSGSGGTRSSSTTSGDVSYSLSLSGSFSSGEDDDDEDESDDGDSDESSWTSSLGVTEDEDEEESGEGEDSSDESSALNRRRVKETEREEVRAIQQKFQEYKQKMDLQVQKQMEAMEMKLRQKQLQRKEQVEGVYVQRRSVIQRKDAAGRKRMLDELEEQEANQKSAIDAESMRQKRKLEEKMKRHARKKLKRQKTKFKKQITIVKGRR